MRNDPNRQALRDAVATYDATADARAALLFKSKRSEQVYAWQIIEAGALSVVRDAFWRCTQKHNSQAACAVADIGFMRAFSKWAL